jgi:methylenetetrahydrofolate dehydrogenase (NADP+)/methenyltetrahydrofolate cyclohydrolase
MTNSTIINGKEFAYKLCNEVANSVAKLKEQNINLGLAVILVGDDSASQVYVRNKDKKASDLGINSKHINLSANITELELLNQIEKLNNDPKINGILVQLPLPKHINDKKIINAINPNKDVDGFHIDNVGKLFTQQSDAFIPCTPLGCLLLLNNYFKNDLAGKNIVIFGRSNIVGRPISELLQQQNCTTTLLHSKSKNILDHATKADVIIAAIGKANFINQKYIKEGAVIIDVGINRIIDPQNEQKTRLVGDVDFSAVINKVAAITPVPGGVGPMTIACLMLNTLKAASVTEYNKIIASIANI